MWFARSKGAAAGSILLGFQGVISALDLWQGDVRPTSEERTENHGIA